MPVTARHAGTVKKGQLVLADPSAWRAAVSRHEGRDVWVTVSRQQHARTLPQNRLYWAWCSEIGDYCGEPSTTIHEYLKEMFLKRRDVELLEGKHLIMPPSTRLLTVDEFRSYMDQIQNWALTFLGLVLPEAGQLEAVL